MAIAKFSSKKEIAKHGYNGSLHHYYDNFTRSKLADELTLILSSKIECDIFEDTDGKPYLHIFRPYLNQAEGFIYRVNTYEYPPVFVIWKEDIPAGLVQALQELGIVAMKRIVTEVVRRLYESVDSDYFHTNGLYNKTPWTFGKSTKK